jgi:glucose/arabinose dehydrogenase
MLRAALLAGAVALFAACTSEGNHASSRDAGRDAAGDAPSDAPSDASEDAPPDAPPSSDASTADPCALPGAVVFTAAGRSVVPGGAAGWPDLGFLTLPPGFCAHYYGTVGDARQLRFAPGGELFVASPSALSTGGNSGSGLSAIVVLPDDDHDGVADATLTFLSFPKLGMSGAMSQGMLFAPGFFYYQDGAAPGTSIMRVPYASGDRKPSGASEQVASLFGPGIHTSALHWPKTMDIADDGTLYVANASDQAEACVEPHVFVGGVYQIDPAPGGPNPNGKPIAQGLRNPIAIRCAKGHDQCFALELAKDYSGGAGGREKLIPIRPGDDWGYPCCATQGVPYAGTTDQHDATPDCAAVTGESNAFLIGDTPFGVDFEGGRWPAPWTGQAFVVTHGALGTWAGARMVAIPMNPATGLPEPSTNLDGGAAGMVDFATGWDPAQVDGGVMTNGRPAALAFAPDGRLFVANDYTGVIFWIAPAM